ncbi:YfcC family protein [Jeotgalibaca sp. MA1X17-3]|uniref:YfcC family protein n=1 Tax=Jeotgalibaca sp. MA1X17-3 TaxID=2908211 RepID=UPI001F35BCCD|nr:YfcC family protein [Jeotgalibaca sp. MA1X17-3]UJF15406.1 YfcC family protein [Jeotgalibaca sp. MA1X17-3]
MEHAKKEKNKQWKMPSSYTILLMIITFVAVLSWIVPAGMYDTDAQGNIIAGTYQVVERNPQGLWDVFMAPIKGMIGTKDTPGAIQVSLFILFIGGFLGVVNKTNAINQGIASIVKKNKGKEKLLIPILMVIFALGGTSFGMSEETMAFYPLIIPVMLAVGFDTIVAVAVVLLGAGIGVLASTVNPFATGVASQSLGITPGDGIIWRLLLLLILNIVGIIYVYRYATKIEKDPSKSFMPTSEEHVIEPEKETKVESMTQRQKGVLTLFVLTFLTMIVSLIPWSSINPSWTFFEDIHAWITSFSFSAVLFGKNSSALGSWYFEEITMLFFVMAIIVGLVDRMKEDEIVANFFVGARDLLGVALVVGVARGIQVVMNEGLITATVLHLGEQSLAGLSPVLFSIFTFIFYIPMSFLIPSTSGLAAATMGIMGPLGDFVGVPSHVIVTAYQSASGMVNLFTPTSGVVMGALAIGGIGLTTWWKFVWKLVAIVFVVICLVLALAVIMS